MKTRHNRILIFFLSGQSRSVCGCEYHLQRFWDSSRRRTKVKISLLDCWTLFFLSSTPWVILNLTPCINDKCQTRGWIWWQRCAKNAKLGAALTFYGQMPSFLFNTVPLHALKQKHKRLNRRNRRLVLVTGWSKELILIKDCRGSVRGVGTSDEAVHIEAYIKQYTRTQNKTSKK